MTVETGINVLKVPANTAGAMVLTDAGSVTEPLDPPMESRIQPVWKSVDEKVSTGVWECDSGRYRPQFAGRGEVFQIISGHLTCTSDDGVTTDGHPGDTLIIPPGWRGVWHVDGPLRKIYVSFRTG